MACSVHYRTLRANVRSLRRALLPDRFSKTGSYPDSTSVHVRTLSFRVLVHAEIEVYIESAAMALFDAAWSRWLKDGVATRVIVAILSFSGNSMSKTPVGLGVQGFEECEGVVKSAQNVWRYNHKNNQGLKEESVLRLLLPLGVSAASLSSNSTLLADLSSFGQERGAAAHTSHSQARQFADPKVEFARVTNLVSALRWLDDIINEELRRVRRAR